MKVQYGLDGLYCGQPMVIGALGGFLITRYLDPSLALRVLMKRSFFLRVQGSLVFGV